MFYVLGDALGWHKGLRTLIAVPAALPHIAFSQVEAYYGASPLILAYMAAATTSTTPIWMALAIQRLRSLRVIRPQTSHSVSRFSCKWPQWSQAMVRRRGTAKVLE